MKKAHGRQERIERSAEQTDIARFWEFTERIPTIRLPARFRRRKPGLVENARLFALASLATADAFIAIFDAKYAYNFWRPVTAIRNGDMDGNDATSGMPLGSR